MKCYFFVDESGDAGIGKIRTSTTPGASPYMTLGGALVRERNLKSAREKLVEIKTTIGKDLHCKDLSHQQKVLFSREINELKIMFFGVISRKETLGEYKDEIDNKKFYNKCAQYILELLGDAARHYKIPSNNLEIIFEEGNFEYEKLRNLVRKCQMNPIREKTKLLRYIRADNISSKKKEEEPLLCTADLVAHSLFKCIDKTPSNYFIP